MSRRSPAGRADPRTSAARVRTGVRTSAGEAAGYRLRCAGTGWPRMSRATATNASRVCCGLAGDQQRAVERLRNRLGRSRRRLVLLDQLPGAKICSEIPPSNSAATNIVPSGRSSRIRSERFFHIRTILTPVPQFPFSTLPKCLSIPREAAMMQRYRQIDHEDIDRRRPSRGLVGMPVVVRRPTLR